MKKERITALITTAMRISFIHALLISIGTFSSYANSAEAQGVLKKNVHITATKMSLKNLLQQVESQSQVKFVYSPSAIGAHRIVEVDIQASDLAAVLDGVLAPLNIAYKIDNGRILLSQQAQQKEITGRVIDAASNEPLPGVSVLVKNTNSGILTNEQGAFSLTANVNDVIVVSYIGYTSQEFTVTSEQDTYSISLESQTSDLDEVVVTGYSSQRRRDITGSVAVVNVNEMKSQPAASAVEALQGRAPGVNIVTDGAPGSTPQIRIRGFSTINNNEPLYVIDGVPYEGKLSWLNQNDIESMQVLKDASAASIYGARANNGVVIVTTKQGLEGKPRITLDANYGSQVPRSSGFPTMMGPQQYAENLYQSYRNSGLNPASELSRLYGGGENPVLPGYLLAGSAIGADVTPELADPANYNYSRDPGTFYQITEANQAGTNWFDEMMGSAPMQNYQLGATGGSENATYAMSAGYLGQKGIIKHTGFERFNLRSNTQFSAFNNKFRFGENAQYSYTENFGMGSNVNVPGEYQDEGSPLGFAYRIPTIVPVYDVMGNFAGTRGGMLGNAQNPLAMLYRGKDNKNRSNFFFGNVFGEVDLAKGLVARTSFGLRYENYNGLSMAYPNLEFSEGTNNNNLSEYQGYNTEWTWTNTLNYRLNINDDHILTVLAGTEAIRNRSRQLNGARNDFFVLGNLDYYYLDTGTSNISNSSFGDLGSLFSLFAKADYSLKDRYLFSATVRRDGSSNFGSENKYGVFPAGSFAWRLSQEEFMSEADWLTDLKVRATYGITGNQRIPAFQFLDRIQSSLITSTYPINGSGSVTGIRQHAYSNPDVKWEEVSQLNFGLDFTLFNGKFDGTFDWYDKKTTDMLYQVPLPSVAVGGGTSPYVNVGDMRNRGFEINLGYHYGREDDRPFKFDVGLNFTRNVNEVLSLAPGVTQQIYGNFRTLSTTVLRAGAPFGSFFGYQVAGIYQNEAELESEATYAGARVGGLKYADINGDGVIDPEDRTIIGNPHPDFIYSISFNASYKNFDVSMFFNASQGNDLYEATRYFTDFTTFDGALTTRLLDAWSPTNTGSNIPSLYRGASDFEYASSSYYVQDGSFFRMRNLQIGYTLPTENMFTRDWGIDRMRIYLGITNLFTITNYTGLDPEVSQAGGGAYPVLGVDRGIYPLNRQFLFGVNLSF
ncbi:TonB-dependent receptor [Olivibacter sp. SDN3]|uniref:TonB-dependent receptor n=1 Tax=Olivibacter sp. SDN3 TaxID=2764720 RepID=UPI0016510508|nr:TonB-dependent receptor [Olivibacter sp. SDN3]QNL49151.1 TonB-dependent receptor [Olivibacter sp. SDN3]